MERRNFVYKVQTVVEKTPEMEYGSILSRVWEKFGERIIDFRPPKKDDIWVDIFNLEISPADAAYAEAEYEKIMVEFPRFILRPTPKVLGEYKVTVYNEPPKRGEYYTCTATSFSHALDDAILRRSGEMDKPYENYYRVAIEPLPKKDGN